MTVYWDGPQGTFMAEFPPGPYRTIFMRECTTITPSAYASYLAGATIQSGSNPNNIEDSPYDICFIQVLNLGGSTPLRIGRVCVCVE